MEKPVIRWLFFALVFAAGIVLLILRESSLQATGQLRAAFLPVPQGAATLLTTERGKTVIIGGGKDLTLFEEMGEILPFLDRTIDLLILPDARMVNLTTLAEITERYTLKHALMPSPLPETLTVHRDILDAHHVPVTDVGWEEVTDLGEGLTVTMMNRGKSKSVIVTITTDHSRIDLPGSVDDLDGDFSASVLRGIVWKDDAIDTVVIRDAKEDSWIKDVTVRNVATEGRVMVTLP